METKQITKSDEELYCEVHRNLEMSAESTTAVMKKVDNPRLLEHLSAVVMKSAELLEKTETLMKERGLEAKSISKMKELSVDMGIMMNTMFDSSDSHIAEMMVKGLEMGVVSLRNMLKDNPPRDEHLAALCTDVVSLESTYAHTIGKFVEQ